MRAKFRKTTDNLEFHRINEKRQLAGTGDVVEGVANSLLTFLSSAVGATVGDAVDLLAVVTERVLGGVVGGAAGALNGVVETRAENVNGALD